MGNKWCLIGICMGWNFIVVLICIYLMFSEVGHIFMSLLVVYVSLEKYLLESFAYFLIGLFVFYCGVLGVLYLSWILTLIRYMIYRYLLWFSGLPLYFIHSGFWDTKFKNFRRGQFVSFLCVCLCFWCHIQEGDREVAPSCLTLCDPVDCSPPGSSVHGVSQARTLEWVTISFSRDWTQVSRTVGRCFLSEPPGANISLYKTPS